MRQRISQKNKLGEQFFCLFQGDKTGSLLGKRSAFSFFSGMNKRAQATIEYFLIFAVVFAVIVNVGSKTSFIDKVRDVFQWYFDEAKQEILK